MFFKADVKTQVSNKLKELYGRDAKFAVSGERLSPLSCKRQGLPGETYETRVLRPDGYIFAVAHSRDWRKSYKMLKTRVEDAWARGVRL